MRISFYTLVAFALSGVTVFAAPIAAADGKLGTRAPSILHRASSLAVMVTDRFRLYPAMYERSAVAFNDATPIQARSLERRKKGDNADKKRIQEEERKAKEEAKLKEEEEKAKAKAAKLADVVPVVDEPAHVEEPAEVEPVHVEEPAHPEEAPEVEEPAHPVDEPAHPVEPPVGEILVL